MVGISATGGYVPRLRLARSAIVGAHSWADPGLASKGKGERSICNWDEDAITMAVEATRDCLRGRDLAPDAIYMASTSLPYADRQHAGIISTAVGLGEDIASMDVGFSQRAGTSALIQALAAVAGGAHQQALVVAADKRRTKASSAGELAYGDAAAAVTIDANGDGLRFLGSHTRTVDFVDHFRAAGEEFDYTWEERWIRDEGLNQIVPEAIGRALEKVGRAAADINHFVMPSTIGRAVQGIAKAAGIAPEAIAGNLDGVLGESGAAHPLVMLLNVLETGVQPGALICLVGFGQGCDVLLFEAGAKVGELTGTSGIQGWLANRQEEDNYHKYLAFNDLITLEKGMRAEVQDFKTALTVNYRKRDMLTGLVGGKCTQCGTPQFPPSDICVNPQCGAEDTQEPYAFRDEPATVLTWSADYLTFIPNPPSHYGMITFNNGGRFMTDFSDVNVGELEVGMDVRMMFRIKSTDNARGWVRYFWKAVPVPAS